MISQGLITLSLYKRLKTEWLKSIERFKKRWIGGSQMSSTNLKTIYMQEFWKRSKSSWKTMRLRNHQNQEFIWKSLSKFLQSKNLQNPKTLRMQNDFLLKLKMSLIKRSSKLWRMFWFTITRAKSIISSLLMKHQTFQNWQKKLIKLSTHDAWDKSMSKCQNFSNLII